MKPALLIFLLATGIGQAQDTVSSRRSPRVVLKISPLTLVNFDPTIQGAVEIRTGKRQSVQAEFGYCRPFWGQNSGNASGFGQREYWRARTEYRFYLNRVRNYFISSKATPIRDAAPLGSYLALDAYFKQINVVDQRLVTRNYQNALYRYSEKLHAPVTRFVSAVYVKYGYQRTFSSKNGLPSRFLIDTSVGLGIRRIQVERHGIDSPTDYYYHPTDVTIGNRFDKAFNVVTPDLTINLKIGYLF